MNRFKNQLLMAAGFAVLAGLISGITAAPAIAQAIKAALVKNVDEPGRTPFEQTVSPGSTQQCPTVPNNQRFVVQHVSGQLIMSEPATGFHVTIHSTYDHYFTLTDQLNEVSGSVYTIDSQELFYINHGDSCAYGAQTGLVDFGTITYSGYLVDLTI